MFVNKKVYTPDPENWKLLLVSGKDQSLYMQLMERPESTKRIRVSDFA